MGTPSSGRIDQFLTDRTIFEWIGFGPAVNSALDCKLGNTVFMQRTGFEQAGQTMCASGTLSPSIYRNTFPDAAFEADMWMGGVTTNIRGNLAALLIYNHKFLQLTSPTQLTSWRPHTE